MTLSFRKALIWSALSGFLALAWEIVWARVFNFASGSRAPVFGYMLASYLAGLAIGSLWSRRWHGDRMAMDFGARWMRVGDMVNRANISAFLVAPLTAWICCFVNWEWGFALVALSGALLGIVFPLLCHEAVEASPEAGQHLSWLYLANIIGSGAGSLLTGFVLMDWLGLHALSLVLLAASCAWAVSIAGKLSRGMLIWPAVIAIFTTALFDGLYERLQYKSEYTCGMRFAHVVESRHGVITVDTSNCVYGNGAYDGVIETKLEPRSWLVRPYFLSAVKEDLKEVLVIGVASGAWTEILARHPQIEKITAIELSHGYLELIAQYPQVKDVLTNPKVELVIDDGRRWLRRHPDRKFDAIVMNTTHHWREFASALLSKEFLTQVNAHLKPDGIAFWNCTDSPRAARTGMDVFPHTMMVINHCLASNSPISIDAARWERVLRQYGVRPEVLPGILDFVKNKETPGEKWRWMSREWMEREYGSAAIITDDNLGHEY